MKDADQIIGYTAINSGAYWINYKRYSASMHTNLRTSGRWFSFLAHELHDLLGYRELWRAPATRLWVFLYGPKEISPFNR
jgi:hypothetical protein